MTQKWTWVQPTDQADLLRRLADARDLDVPPREMENLCACAHAEIMRLNQRILGLTAHHRCKTHGVMPGVNTVWGCADCLYELRHEVAQLKALLERQKELVDNVLKLQADLAAARKGKP